MYDFSKTYELKSESFPGVVVTLRRMGPPERAAVELKMSATRSRQRELATALQSTRDKLNAALATCPKGADGQVIEPELSAEALELGNKWLALKDEALALSKSMDAAYVVAAVKSITEMTFEGKPATAELICAHGPDALFDEIAAAISANTYLTPEKASNFGSPTTLDAQADGQATNMTASAAANSAATSSATAASSSPST